MTHENAHRHSPVSGGNGLIAIFCSTFPPESGGAAGRIYNLAVLLRKAGFAVQVICAMPNYPTGRIFPAYRRRLVSNEVLDGIMVRRIWMIPSNSSYALSRGMSIMSFVLSLRRLAYRTILRQKPKLVIVSSPPLPMATDVVRFFRKHHYRILLNVSDIWPLSASALGAVTESSLYRLLQKQEAEMYSRADAFTAQSAETLAHIREIDIASKPEMLFRNLPASQPVQSNDDHRTPLQIIYPGVLGHAQGLFELCQAVDFRAMGVALHIYGAGPELPQIEAYIAEHPSCNVYLHRPVPPEELMALLPDYRAMLIPHIAEINGAVPSKLFTAIYAGLPVLYSGSKEGADIVRSHNLGWVAAPADYMGIAGNIGALCRQSIDANAAMRRQIHQAASEVFNKEAQDAGIIRFIEQLISVT